MKKNIQIYNQSYQNYYDSRGIKAQNYDYTSISLFFKPGLVIFQQNIQNASFVANYEFDSTAPVEYAYPIIMISDKFVEDFNVISGSSDIILKFLNYGFIQKNGKNILYVRGLAQNVIYWNVALQYKPPAILEIVNHNV